jgi:hypothetical protein
MTVALMAVLVMAGLSERASGSATAAANVPAGKLDAPAGRRSAGKLQPPVEVSLVPVRPLQAGVPAQLALQVRSAEQIEGIELAVEGDEGLEVVSATREVPGTRVTGYQADGEATRFEISTVPMSGGTRQLSGLVRFTVNGVAQAAPFRLAVEVGGPVTVPALRSQKPDREPSQDATGDLIDSMKAETTIR